MEAERVPKQRSPRLRRTLLSAAVCALIAMALVPCVGGHTERAYDPRWLLLDAPIWNGGYRLVFAMPANSRINVAQLILNVSFAAILGAVAANVPRRVQRVIAAIAVAGATVFAGLALKKFRAAAVSRAESDESMADGDLYSHGYASAKEYFRQAKLNWWIAGDFSNAEMARTNERNCPEPGTSLPADQDFARASRKLREQALLKVEPQVFAPTDSHTATTARYPWKTNIVTIVFWIGEPNAGRSRSESSWDRNWMQNYGGVDDPDSSARRNYIPVKFVPRQNPFYCGLPYDDVTQGEFKPEAPLVIPWFKTTYTESGRSVCKDRWVAIRKGNRICYAQWEDCGPLRTDHFQYVFQSERSKPNAKRGAGLEVSPAVRDYLGLSPLDVTDWQFVEVRDVPPGPWRNYGDNNHFVIAKRQAEQRLLDGPSPSPSPQSPDAASFSNPTPLPSPTLTDRQ
jgi:hypothetical protein